MVSDFFYPRLGGVEMHIWSLSQCLLHLGHKVVVLTNQYGKRAGVRFMTNGLKVYYAPVVPFVDQDSMPTLWTFLPYLRNILIRERITIVHGHQATSTLAHECLFFAKCMGYKAVYTDHSLFGFADMASINLNKWMKFSCAGMDHAICVSHTCRENLVLRAALDPRRTSAIPNAIDARKFTPDPSARWPSDTVNIVMVSRLVYRKGVDLVVHVIPEICKRFPNVHFIIGGDGDKRLLLEEMRERHALHDRVEMLGAVPHSRVRDTLVRGHIFLNCSLTESFCIAILEAACAGLYVVSTRVGGVPEVLPPRMITFAEASPASIIDALATAIPQARHVEPHAYNTELAALYNWRDVAARTVAVYDRVALLPQLPLLERLRRFYGTGRVVGLLAVALAVMVFLIWRLVEWLLPEEDIDLAPEFPRVTFAQHVSARTLNLRQEYATMAVTGGADSTPSTAPTAAQPTAPSTSKDTPAREKALSSWFRGYTRSRGDSCVEPGMDLRGTPQEGALSQVAAAHAATDAAAVAELVGRSRADSSGSAGISAAFSPVLSPAPPTFGLPPR